MFDFFEQILGFFELAWQFFLNLFDMLVVLLRTLTAAVELPIQLSLVLPSVLGASVIIFLAVFVVKFIVGR